VSNIAIYDSVPNCAASDRLPVPLGGFISETVYEGKLRSSHDIVDHSCVVFIDVEKGEEVKRGNSYEVSIPARGWLLV
jgi:hypothetical protein